MGKSPLAYAFDPGIRFPSYLIRNRLLRSIKKLAPELKGHLMDFGCGAKPYRSLFTVDEYTGVDFENPGHPHLNEQIDVFYDGKHIPFGNDTFDAVFSSEVFEHVFNLDEALRELNRVMKTGASILVTCPFAICEHEVPNDFARYSSFGLRSLFECHGFEVIRQEKTGNSVEVVFQLWIMYLHQHINPKFRKIPVVRSAFRLFTYASLNILALAFSRLLPRRQDLYLNNVILCKKVRNTSMKIAVISMIREPWGGSEELWFAMAKRAIAEGHTVIHLSFDFDTLHPRLQELQQLGGILLHRPGYYPPDISPRDKQKKVLVNFIRKKLHPPLAPLFRHAPDIIVYNGTAYSIAQETDLLRNLEKNNTAFYIISQLNGEDHRSFPSGGKDVITRAYERAQKIFFVSQRNRQVAESHICRPLSNAFLVRNPVNMTDLSLIPYPSSPSVQWALVGNLIISHKGQDMLLAVLQQTRWRERDWALNIYGDGSDKRYLQELVQYYQLSDKVIFHGRVGNIRQVWEQNQALLMPSYMEGMPLAIVEAMLCGRPCIATDVGGASEWIEDGVTGFLAEAAAVPSLDQALERAWQQRDKWLSIGVQAHQRAVELYDADPGKTLLDKLIHS